jgi:hypothetical protein
LENNNLFTSREFLPRTWNDGMLECWNSGRLVFIGYYPIIFMDVYENASNKTFPGPSIPLFQHSNISIGAKPQFQFMNP